MKKAVLITITAVLLAISLPAFAQEFPDVPPDHWAYDAVQELVNAGIIQGYPDGTYGGKRAMSRYEFAEALAKAIPAIEERIAAGLPGGVPGPAGPAGPAGPPGAAGPGAEEVQALRKLIDEFRDELAALGVDVEALRRDVAALNERVIALEEEVARVVFTGEVNLIGRGEVRNSAVALDKDSGLLSVGAPAGEEDNPLANSSFFTDLDFAMKARVGDDASVNAVINAGDYLNWALTPAVWTALPAATADDFTLWNLYADAAMNLGPLGPAQVVVGRFPFQLTPLTLKFVDPDSYADVTKLDNGDYLLDGGRVSLNLGRIALTAFAAKAQPITDLLSPDLFLPGSGFSAEEVSQIAGARAVIGMGASNLGLTYYQAGAAHGRSEIIGADINANLGSLGLAAEFAESRANLPLQTFFGISDEDDTAWNAELSWQTGNLALTGGYTQVEANYHAPGYWNRLSTVVNPVNVEGASASLTYALSSRISIKAEGQFLEPADTANIVNFRTSTVQGPVFAIPGVLLDKINYLKAGISYGLSSASTLDLEWEETKWEPVAGNDIKDRYVTLGLGHALSPNATLKLLYQITEFELTPTATARGGVATAQFQAKY